MGEGTSLFLLSVYGCALTVTGSSRRHWEQGRTPGGQETSSDSKILKSTTKSSDLQAVTKLHDVIFLNRNKLLLIPFSMT